MNRSIFGVLLAGMAMSAHAYENKITHTVLSAVSAERSALYSDPSLLADWGFKSANDELFQPPEGEAGTISALVARGAEVEDDLSQIMRVFNHFFDPQNGMDTSWLPAGYRGLWGAGLVVNGASFGHRSPDWALEDFGDVSSKSVLFSSAVLPMRYSFRNGQEHFFAALTGSSPTARRESMGAVFKSLGHVIHHVQDMAQPQHARNDPHTPLQGYAAWYEDYTARFVDAASYLATSYNNGVIPQFSTAREFWSDSPGAGPRYRGMADFSAYNYITTGTAYNVTVGANGSTFITPKLGYPYPAAVNRDGTPRTMATTQVNIRLSRGNVVTRNMTYLMGKVYDELTNSYTSSRPLAASSVLNPHLTKRGMPITLIMDSHVFDSNYSVLLPRAVAFSSGMINHFFRGRLNLERSGTDTKWVITNTGSQPMNGEFTLYRDDANGIRTAVQAPWTASLPAAATITKTVPEQPAGTSKLTVAFRGQIGAEGSVSSGFYAVAGKSVAYTFPPTSCDSATQLEGGFEGADFQKELGSNKSGEVKIQFEAYGIRDGLTVESQSGTQLATTGGLITGFRALSFNYNNTTPGATKARVRVNAPDPNTWWKLVVGCPGQDLTPQNGGLRRVQVRFRFGTPITGSIGSCTAQAQIDGGTPFTVWITSTGTTETSATMTAGPQHVIQFSGYKCSLAPSNLLPTASYTDSAGTHSLGNVNSTTPRYFDVD